MQPRKVVVDHGRVGLPPAALERVAGGDQVFLDREVLEHMAAFAHMGDAAPRQQVRWHLVDGLAQVADRAGAQLADLQRQQAGDRLQRGGLARAVAAQERDDLARGTVSESPRSTCTECWYTTSMFSIASAGAASPGPELMPS